MSISRKYTIKDANPMNWDEFGVGMDRLLAQIQNYVIEKKITINAIAPILRNGAIPGTIIANKLQITTIVPIQCKYNYETKKPTQLLPFYKPLALDLGEFPTILVTDCNTFSGQSALLSAQIIQKVYPRAELYFATLTRVYRAQEISLPMYNHYFFGQLTNENFEADGTTQKSLNLRKGITIFPWERAEQELRDINEYLGE